MNKQASPYNKWSLIFLYIESAPACVAQVPKFCSIIFIGILSLPMPKSIAITLEGIQEEHTLLRNEQHIFNLPLKILSSSYATNLFLENAFAWLVCHMVTFLNVNLGCKPEKSSTKVSPVQTELFLQRVFRRGRWEQHFFNLQKMNIAFHCMGT